jgi:hypothetical protein
MKSIISAACLSLALAVAAVGAQSHHHQQEAGEKAGTVTLTGCLERGTEPNTYVLRHVTADFMIDPHHEEETEATTGEAATTFWLDGTEDIDMNLEEHIGHTVEVTGRIAPKVEEETTERETEATTGERRPLTDLELREAHRIEVESLRHISATCEPRR